MRGQTALGPILRKHIFIFTAQDRLACLAIEPSHAPRATPPPPPQHQPATTNQPPPLPNLHAALFWGNSHCSTAPRGFGANLTSPAITLAQGGFAVPTSFDRVWPSHC
ncbi:hypothetical protein IF2G_04962 [Cordyceps javanica]|nr:hypothetical protein IF2G_04962 [Cordyceps javanica]